MNPVFEQLPRTFVQIGVSLPVPATISGHRPGLWYAAVGGPIAGFNRLFATEMNPATVDADLDTVLDELRDVPVLSAWIPPGVAPSDLARRFVERGFVVDPDGVPAMAAQLRDLPPIDPPEGVTWSRVDSPERLRVLLDVDVAGFEVPDSFRQWFELALGPLSSPRPDVGCYVLSTDGRPSATALGVVADDVLGIYNVATVPAARGRGLGALATRLVMRHGADHGARTAVLESSDVGYSLYQRLGFVDMGRYQVLLRRHEGTT